MYSEILGLSFNAETPRRREEEILSANIQAPEKSHATMNADEKPKEILTGGNRGSGDETGMLKTYIFSYTAGSGVPALPPRRMENDPHNHPLNQKKWGTNENKRVERVVVNRIKPLKAMQVVDFPDIEENKGFNAKSQRCRDAKENEVQSDRATDGTDFTDLGKATQTNRRTS